MNSSEKSQNKIDMIQLENQKEESQKDLTLLWNQCDLHDIEAPK